MGTSAPGCGSGVSSLSRWSGTARASFAGHLLVLQHGSDAPAGYLGEILSECGIQARMVDLVVEELPASEHWAGVVSLGGIMGAYEDDRYPWLAAERRFLLSAVSAGIPTLGICLGCQQLAAALGGRAHAGAGSEMGLLRLQLTAVGLVDSVVRHLDGPVPVAHADTWDLPPGAVLLAHSDRYPHAFRLGSALGVQAHPEASPQIFSTWFRASPDDASSSAGREALISAAWSNAANQEQMARSFFGAWLEEVAAAGPRTEFASV